MDLAKPAQRTVPSATVQIPVPSVMTDTTSEETTTPSALPVLLWALEHTSAQGLWTSLQPLPPRSLSAKTELESTPTSWSSRLVQPPHPPSVSTSSLMPASLSMTSTPPKWLIPARPASKEWFSSEEAVSPVPVDVSPA
jgi:hypothetical protein